MDPFKLVDGQWLIDVPKLEMVLPEENILVNQDIKTVFGFGPLLIMKNNNGQELEEDTLTLATKFNTKPVDIEYDKETELYHFKYDSEHATSNPFMMSQNVISDISNVEFMFDLIAAGKVNNNIPYEHYLDIVLNNMDLNKSLDISERDIEILLSEYLRDAENPSVPVRVTGNVEYLTLPYKDLVANQSTWAAISHEDPKTMLAVSLVRDEEDESPSPLEKYAKL